MGIKNVTHQINSTSLTFDECLLDACGGKISTRLSSVGCFSKNGTKTNSEQGLVLLFHKYEKGLFFGRHVGEFVDEVCENTNVGVLGTSLIRLLMFAAARASPPDQRDG